MIQIQDTSLEAYEVLQPRLGDLQRRIFNLLKMFPDSSNSDLSEISNIKISTVTPRVKELREIGLVICSGYKTDPYTRTRVMCWRVVNSGIR